MLSPDPEIIGPIVEVGGSIVRGVAFSSTRGHENDVCQFEIFDNFGVFREADVVETKISGDYAFRDDVKNFVEVFKRLMVDQFLHNLIAPIFVILFHIIGKNGALAETCSIISLNLIDR